MKHLPNASFSKVAEQRKQYFFQSKQYFFQTVPLSDHFWAMTINGSMSFLSLTDSMETKAHAVSLFTFPFISHLK